MATVTLRIDDSVRDRLQSMADGRAVSLSDLLRTAIDGLFDERDEPGRPPVVPESLTPIDRRQLALLHRILARLVEDRTDDERLGHDGDTTYQLDRAEALEEGWSREYDMEFIAIQPELSRRDCGLVMDLLDMFRTLGRSVSAAGDELGDETKRMLVFRGFDLNDEHESRLLAYSRSLVTDGRWSENAELFSDAHDRGNSHGAWLGAYRRMLAAYEPIWRGLVRDGGREQYLLTTAELELVAHAATHPDRRRKWQ